MRVMEQWWEESTVLLARPVLSQAFFSLSVLHGSRTSEVGKVVYSQAENKMNISTKLCKCISFNSDIQFPTDIFLL